MLPSVAVAAASGGLEDEDESGRSANDSAFDSELDEDSMQHSASTSSVARSFRQVDLSFRDLEDLPQHYVDANEVYSPALVRSLKLQHNRLITLPSEISRFTQLRTLDLSNNGLADLPNAIGLLTHLRVLSVANNNLEKDSFPKSFVHLQNLQGLNVGGNRIVEFPRCLFELPQLNALYFGANRLQQLPYDISKLQALQVLYLGGNRLVEIPATIGRLRCLESLVLCDNRLETIPSTIADLDRLESLSLHNNRLTTLPPEIIKLRRLHQLSLRSNPLVARFVRDMAFDPPTLRELAGRVVKMDEQRFPCDDVLPRELLVYLHSANQCVNPKCRVERRLMVMLSSTLHSTMNQENVASGVYFEACVEHVKFVDFCGKFRVPLLQYLCSPQCRRRPAHRAPHPIAASSSFELTSSDSETDYTSDPEQKKLKKVLLG